MSTLRAQGVVPGSRAGPPLPTKGLRGSREYLSSFWSQASLGHNLYGALGSDPGAVRLQRSDKGPRAA